ncbi:hypothetical protein [Arthrobacter sp. 35W]|uniref:hypothetical protein n=1 Tax=Arthrobacter sp. 35W TaxID=1132441 RepID=UPI00047D3D17|nr:hypothetical protein [Arthrobacter sp. 35W]
MTVFIVLASGLLLLAGVVLIAAWGGASVRPPPGPSVAALPPEARSGRLNRALRRYAWWANVACFAAFVSAVLIAWPGGRLVMRVLAMTSPAQSQGMLTEAGAVVGLPTVDGTLSLLVFGGLPAAFAATFIYLLVHRLLPPGRLNGPLAGLAALLLLGSFLEPFRANNIDFTIVGPGLLSVALFAVLAVLLGALVAAAAGWYSQRLPLPSGRAAKAYWPLVAGMVFLPAGILIGIGALIVVAFSAIVRSPHGWASRKHVWVGRSLLGLAVLAALPAFIGSLGFILFR